MLFCGLSLLLKHLAETLGWAAFLSSWTRPLNISAEKPCWALCCGPPTGPGCWALLSARWVPEDPQAGVPPGLQGLAGEGVQVAVCGQETQVDTTQVGGARRDRMRKGRWNGKGQAERGRTDLGRES